MEVDVYMCIKKVACGLQKVVKEDGREVLEPIFVEVETPEDMHRITSKIDSCKTVTPKIIEENTKEVELVALTVTNEHEGDHGGEHVGVHGNHGGATVIGSPITDSNDAPIGNDSPIGSNNDSPMDNNDSPIGNNDSPIGNGSPREVVCIETGEVFANATQAGKAIGTARQNITACCTGRRKKAGGFQWKYL